MSDPESKEPEKSVPQIVSTPMTTEGNSYLHELCLKNAPVSEVRDAVLTLGANMQALNKKGIPPIGIAIINNNLETIQCLIDLGAKLYFPSDKGLMFNALALAISFNRADALKLLLQNGGSAYVNKLAYPAEGETVPSPYPYRAGPEKEPLLCLSHAVREGRISLLEILSSSGAFMNEECGKDSLFPLQRAVFGKDPSMLEQLIRLGADLDQQSPDGRAALHMAVMLNQPLLVAKLLDFGANPDLPLQNGTTPLMYAAEAGHVAIVRLLLDAAEGVAEQKIFEKAYDKLNWKPPL